MNYSKKVCCTCWSGRNVTYLFNLSPFQAIIMFGVIDTEYIGPKYSSSGVIFEAAFSLLDEQRLKVNSCKWNVK
jgi:hypothetical protein